MPDHRPHCPDLNRPFPPRRIIVAYGAHLSRFQHRLYTIDFICCDLLSLALQAAGGGITSHATNEKNHEHGLNIMVTGLCLMFPPSWSLSSGAGTLLHVSRALARVVPTRRTLLYGILARFAASFMVSVSSAVTIANTFLGLRLATLGILIRSCFRVTELSHGFGSNLANQQVTFMILEGNMIVIASVTLTSLYPGVAFQGSWAEADFTVWHSHKHGAVDEGDAEGGANDTGEAEIVVFQIMEK